MRAYAGPTVRVLRLIAVLVMLVSFAGCGSDDSDRDETSSGPPRTWVAPDGQTRTFSPDDLQANDIFRCSDNGAGIEAVPAPGEGEGNNTGILVETDMDGTVTVQCESGPPGNV
jgi:hypothetical protein